MVYKVLIAEDEMLVRFGLKNSVEWDKYGMFVIDDVSNGKEALDSYLQNKPDIIITDIKMPVMDGMELISRIREKDDRTRIIILSCLDEFDLVRKAISLGVSDYILKLTMTGDEIGTILSKVAAELKEKEKTGNDISSGSNVDIVKDRLLKDYIFYHIYSSEEFASRIQELGLFLSSENMVLAVMEIDHYEKLKARFEDDKGYLASYALMNAVNEILNKYVEGKVFHDEASRYILVLNCEITSSEDETYKKAINILRKVKDSLNVYFNTSVSFGLSNIYSDFKFLKTMFNEAATALKAKFYFGSGIFTKKDNVNTRKAVREKFESLYEFYELFGIPDDDYKKEYKRKVSLMLEELPEEKEQIKEVLYQFIYWITDNMHLSGDEIYGIVISHGEALQNAEILNEAVEYIRDFIIALRNYYKTKSVTNEEISKAINYIQENYAEDISLQDVSEYVALSYNYFSSLFKKELQMSFTEYLNEIRIDKAKDFLKNTCLKSYEIAKKVGFKESTYFSMLFKKVTGLSPKRYRQTWQNVREEES